MNQGMFIVFEGLDRSGKTTQIKKLDKYLSSLKYMCNVIQFPNRETEIGKLIDAYLTKKIQLEDHVAHLLFTANRWECIPKIEASLAKSEIVICDRYLYSGIAYSAAKKNIDFDWCKYVEGGLMKPDIVYYLNTSVEEARAREGWGNERYEQAEFQMRVRENYRKLINQSEGVNWKEIDANSTIDDIHEKIVSAWNGFIKKN